VNDHVSDPEDGLNCDLPLGDSIEEDSDLTVDNGNEPEKHGEEQHDSTGDTPGPGEPVVLDLEIVESGSKDPEGNLRDGDEEASDPDPGVPSAGPVNHREATSADLRSGSGGAEGGRRARRADNRGDQGGTGGAGAAGGTNEHADEHPHENDGGDDEQEDLGEGLTLGGGGGFGLLLEDVEG